MPERRLKSSDQVEKWLISLGDGLSQPGEPTLIGSGGLLWQAGQKGVTEPLPENSMARWAFAHGVCTRSHTAGAASAGDDNRPGNPS